MEPFSALVKIFSRKTRGRRSPIWAWIPMLRAKCEVHALGVEAAYWFTPQFNVSVRLQSGEGQLLEARDWILFKSEF
ncbi:MAG: hypothetical protein GY922_01720 [Proteobacteria bacterium]|nr:hypothetical protein [Pseudomonadota bacterium]